MVGIRAILVRDTISPTPEKIIRQIVGFCRIHDVKGTSEAAAPDFVTILQMVPKLPIISAQ